MVHAVHFASNIEFWFESFENVFFFCISFLYYVFINLTSVRTFRFSAPSAFNWSIFLDLLFSEVFLVLQALFVIFLTSCQDLLSRIAFSIAADWTEPGAVVGSTATADSTTVYDLKYSWLCNCDFRHEILALFSTVYKLRTFWRDRTCKCFREHKFCKVHFYWCGNNFYSGILCRSLAISITYTFITSPLCFRGSFPISSIPAFCQQVISDFLFTYIVL